MGISKAQKGTVSISKYRNKIRLRWRYLSKRYSLTLYQYHKLNLVKAKKVALQIEEDMVSNIFDFSLKKYNSAQPLDDDQHKHMYLQFESWVKNYRNKDCDRDKQYHTVRNMLKSWGNIQVGQVLDKLNNQSLNEHTYNRRLAMLQHFLSHQKKNNHILIDPLEGVLPKKEKRSTDKKRQPFTEIEITQILSAFREDTFSNKKNSHSFYYPFIYFIFQLGVRNAEAIGLRAKCLNFEKKIVEIKEVLARSVKGTNAACRVRKETKNGKQRILPIDDKLISILKPIVKGKQPDDLVFLSPKGLSIDDRLFQKRIFKPVLSKLGIQNRVLYACRHTFGSRCIHEGLTPVMTAFLMGNNPETALRNYTHLIELPKQLPQIA